MHIERFERGTRSEETILEPMARSPRARGSTRRARGRRRCEYCGETAQWKDETGSTACRRGRGCAKRPASHERRTVVASSGTRVEYKLDGAWYSLRALAVMARLPQRCVRRRLELGWTAKDVVSVARTRGQTVSEDALRSDAKPGRPPRLVTVRGECLPLQQWAARLQLSRVALYGLATRRSLSIERLIETRLLEREG